MANPEQVLRIALDVLKLAKRNEENGLDMQDQSSGKNSKLILSNGNVSGSEARIVEKKLKSNKHTNARIGTKSDTNNQKLSITLPNELQSRDMSAQTHDKSPKSPRRPKTSAEIKHLPIIVHCSAGIGRTGCFLAILNGIQQLHNNRNVDVLAILCSLRLNRGGMVQTAEQYELIHRVLSLYTEQM